MIRKLLYALILISAISKCASATEYVALDKQIGIYINEVAYWKKQEPCKCNIEITRKNIRIDDSIFDVLSIREYEYKKNSKNVIYYCSDGLNEIFIKLVLYYDGRKRLIYRDFGRNSVKYFLYEKVEFIK